MKLKDIEVDFDFLDADDIERFENEANKVIEESEKYKDKEISMSEEIKIECNLIDAFLDNVFGEKTSQKLFNGKKNLREHVEIFKYIMDEKIKYTNEISSIYQRYQPNREQRRNNYKGRK